MAVEVVPGRDRPPSMLRVGTVVWLGSELLFFAGLFAGWFTLRAANADWPPDDVHLDTARTGVATLVLVASSFTMHAGHRAAERGDRGRAARWVVVTAALGAVFLANQVLEYADLDFTLTSHAYGSMFFLLTGFHGAHVLGGVVAMLVVMWLGTGRTRAELGEPLAAVSYYWHFVDVVWVVMFASVYLLA